MKKIIYSLLIILAVVCASAQSTTTSYTRTLKFFSSDLLQMYEGARIAAPTMTLPNSLTTYTSTLPFGNSDNRQLYNAIRGMGDALSGFTNTSWNLTGNSVSTNTNFIGTTSNRSLLFRTNNTQRLKIDSLGNSYFTSPSLSWSTTSTGYTNNISLTTYATFTNIPAIYMGVSPNAYSGSNYAILSDGVNNVFNAPRGFFARSGNVNLMNCNATNTASGYFIEFNGISQPTVTAQNHGSARFNSNFYGFEAGSFAQQNNVAIAADTYSSNGATTITDAIGLEVRQATAGTGVTITRPWAISAVGNVNISSRLKIGNVITAQDPTTATLVVIGTASVSSTSTLTGLRNNGTFTTTGAAMIGGTTAGSATLHVLGTFSASSSGTLAGVLSTSSVVSTSKTAGIGYAVGSGSTVTQGTSRTTGVTINDVVGSITLFNTAGSATYQDFTVTNSTVGVNDVIIINQRSGTDRYVIEITAVAAGSFRVTFATTGGTTSEAPVFNFAVIKGATN